MRTEVKLSQMALKQLRSTPSYIVKKLMLWVEGVETDGLPHMRRIPGYHDEPLLGKRLGQRSVRLNRAYRAIYRVRGETSLELVIVEEVSKHEY